MLDFFRNSLGVKVTAKLAVVLLALTAAAVAIVVVQQTRRYEQLMLEKARVVAALGARDYGDTLDAAVDSGIVTVADVFDRNYVPIKGFEWGSNPRFHTRYDVITDRLVLRFQDKFLEFDDFIFAVGVDENGYLPTHNTKFQKPLTGNPEVDKMGNRTKRIFNDPVGLAAAVNTEKSLLQIYKRDTGEVMWDVSSPITVKGKHWGGFRVALSMDRVSDGQRTLLLTLAAIFAGFVLITLGTMYIVVHGAMKPVVRLTEAAEQISLGEGLETPIKSETTDEIGHLTKAVDRLRASMKAAMSRLGH